MKIVGRPYGDGNLWIHRIRQLKHVSDQCSVRRISRRISSNSAAVSFLSIKVIVILRRSLIPVRSVMQQLYLEESLLSSDHHPPCFLDISNTAVFFNQT